KDMVEGIDEDVAALKKLFSQKSISYKTKIPYLQYFDAHRLFQSHIKNISFKNGRGILFLTEYSSDMADYVDNERLSYLFQGLTDDGKYSVFAWFPVTALHFPKDDHQPPFEPIGSKGWTTEKEF